MRIIDMRNQFRLASAAVMTTAMAASPSIAAESMGKDAMHKDSMAKTDAMEKKGSAGK